LAVKRGRASLSQALRPLQEGHEPHSDPVVLGRSKHTQRGTVESQGVFSGSMRVGRLATTLRVEAAKITRDATLALVNQSCHTRPSAFHERGYHEHSLEYLVPTYNQRSSFLLVLKVAIIQPYPRVTG
jgi:hypothetical protein